jgi:antirestriction protein ArdC
MNAKMKEMIEKVIGMIVAALKDGVAVWRKPWRAVSGAASGLQISAATGKPYRGINQAVLSFVAYTAGYKSNVWGTFNKMKKLGGTPAKGERSTQVIYFFWRFGKEEVENPETGELEEKIAWARCDWDYHNIFNMDQCPGAKTPENLIPKPLEAKGHTPVEKAESIISEMIARGNAPKIEERPSNSAYYRPSNDTIVIPSRDQYDKIEDFYKVLFHEVGHATGHKSRLNRKGISEAGRFGDETYSTEELIAETIAADLAGLCGIFDPPSALNTAAYLANWGSFLKENPEEIFHAAARAERGVEWVLGIKPQTAKEKKDEAKAA